MHEITIGTTVFRVVTGCTSGRCPRVLLSSDGNLIVQGRIVEPGVREQLNLGRDEEAVELPADMVTELARHFCKK